MRRLAGKIGTLAMALTITGGMAHSTPAETRSTSLRAALSTLTHSQRLPEGRYGYVLMDAKTGEVLAGRNADDLFIPASLAKIPTTLAALSTLGAERRFETRIMAEGTIIDGVLHGDLHLVGGGDPSLTIRDMEALAVKLAQAGLRQVNGSFTFDASALPRTKRIDAAQSGGDHYNPAVSGLNVDLNLRVKNGQRIPVRAPGYRAAMMLRYYAHGYGVTMQKPVRAPGNAGGTEIAVHRSAPISKIIAKMMDRSTNLTAEALGALSVRSMGNRPKSLSHAAKVTTAWLKSKAGSIGGAEWAGFRLMNHSGLSTGSRATPRQIAAILRLGYRDFGKAFTNLHKQNAPGGYRAYTLRGKFGTMRFVRGYGGFLTIGGRDMVFAIMSNDSRSRALADAGAAGLRSTAWMNKARRLEQAILSDWITDHWSGTAAPEIALQVAPTPEPAPLVIEQPDITLIPTASDQATLITNSTSTFVSFQDLNAPGSRYVRSTRLVK